MLKKGNAEGLKKGSTSPSCTSCITRRYHNYGPGEKGGEVVAGVSAGARDLAVCTAGELQVLPL